ncbi:MAG TPA: aminotransferase class V-fold PLP-dependent enzyme, partial [Sphingomonadaceae bacterium]|nr:aminotransferase class V-fold PLP-dependent enzyme [Sphingomonadaceae bacterium]
MSTQRRSYFDWNATAPLRAEARAAMQAALAATGNASSVHAEGRAARALIEQARADVAALVGAEAKTVIFTAGGTEANALALTPQIEAGADQAPRGGLLVSAVEHPSVLAGGRFERVELLPVDAQG